MNIKKLSVRPSSGRVIVRPSLNSELSVTDGRATYSVLSDDQVIEAALAILAKRVKRIGAALQNPASVRDYLRLRLGELEHEVFGVIYLDNRHRVIDMEELFRGTVDGANVYPREVVKRALVHNAAAAILYHNHPSGVAEPSQADEVLTRRLKESFALIDVRLLDHLVVCAETITSFAEKGLL